MNELMERYIYAVVKRLPEKQREEVKKELRSNIEDMLQGSKRIEDLEEILTQLGEPRILANEYRDKQRHLIGPAWMDDYLNVLKIVMVVVVSLALVFGLFEDLFNTDSNNIFGFVFEVFFKAIGNMWDAALSAFAVVTLVFVGIEAAESSPKKRTWKLQDLPQLPKEDSPKIKRGHAIAGLIFEIIFGSIWIFLLYYNVSYIGWFEEGTGWTVTVPLFSNAAIMTYIPAFIISVIIGIAAELLKVFYGAWNLQVVLGHTIHKFIAFLVMVGFLSMTDLINPLFTEQVLSYGVMDATQIAEMYHGIAIGIIALTALGVVADLIKCWILFLKRGRQSK
ncbi:MAG: hypothetical protein PHP32_05285 [Candidatus Izemoplasmatales bacterium]|nr:hypothetical protein [Candidatus Izemoplasmatales bacterium]